MQLTSLVQGYMPKCSDVIYLFKIFHEKYEANSKESYLHRFEVDL